MNIFKLFGSIFVDSSEAEKSISSTDKKANGLAKSLLSGAKTVGKFGSAAAKVGTVVAAGIGAAATAIGVLTKKALDGYADYEQLVGGVETLFGAGGKSIKEYAASVGKTVSDIEAEYNSLMSAQETVLNNANQAYKTAGMSANEYIETVTSFSASLIKSLDGDTTAAAEKANKAIVDMSDNANKMGSDIASIQNAYQGFAKQNYTMLDNLKLGYGGTKEEMARLLEDAEKFSGIKYDISSYADVVDAIHVIQEEMGITGTTASEAGSTISGSISSMKSALSNLVAGLGNEQADLDALIDEFVDSALTVVDNVMPRIEMILNGITQLIEKIVPKIGEILPGLIEKLLPALITGATALFTGLITALPTILQILIQQIPFIVTQIAQAIIITFPILLSTIQELFGQIWDYIAVGLLGTSADFDSTFATISQIFSDAWTVLQEIWIARGQPIFDTISEIFGILYETIAMKMSEITAFVSQCFTDISGFWELHLKPCLTAIGTFIKTILAPAFKAVFEGTIKPVVDTVFTYIKSIWEGTLMPVFTGITDFLTGVFTLNWQKAWEGIQSILKGILNGIISGIEGMINGAISAINGLIAGINELVSAAGEALGLNVSIPSIPTLNLPRLYKGGVLEKGQVGVLEGDGAEAVVPLENNKKWISALAKDMQEQGIGGSDETVGLLREIASALRALKEDSSKLPEELLDAIANGLKLDVDKREFARLVKAV